MGWKDLIWAEEPGTKKAQQPAPVTLERTMEPRSPPPDLPTNDDIARRLNEATDIFNATDAGRAVLKYLGALEVIADERLRLKTALAQAKKLEGISDQQILDAFTQVETALEEDQVKFSKASDEFMTSEVTDRKRTIAALETNIKDLQAKLEAENTNLASAQGQHAVTTAQYEAASKHRKIELETLRQKFQTILQEKP